MKQGQSEAERWASEHDLQLWFPRVYEAEGLCVAGVWSDEKVFDSVRAFLEPEHFADEALKLLYEAAIRLRETGRPLSPALIGAVLNEDAEVVSSDLQQKGKLGKLLLDLVGQHATSKAAIYAAQVVHDAFVQREIGHACHSIAQRCARADGLSEALDLGVEFAAMMERFRAQRVKEVADRQSAASLYLADLEREDHEPAGVPTVPEIADVLNEPTLAAGRLYGLMCSSGEGKTSLALGMVRAALDAEHPVLFLSYDQQQLEIVQQMVAQDLGIEARRQRRAWELLSGDERERCYEYGLALRAKPFRVIQCEAEGPSDLVGYIRAFTRRQDVDKPALVVIDHASAVTPAASARADEGAKALSVAQPLKHASKALGCATLLLNQRNSAGLNRDNPYPTRSDVHGGQGALRAYDAMLFVYRPHYHRAEKLRSAASEKDKARIVETFGNSDETRAIIGAVKVRFGDTSERRDMIWDGPTTTYKSESPVAQERLVG